MYGAMLEVCGLSEEERAREGERGRELFERLNRNAETALKAAVGYLICLTYYCFGSISDILKSIVDFQQCHCRYSSTSVHISTLPGSESVSAL
jgi:hypothetical protein